MGNIQKYTSLYSSSSLSGESSNYQQTLILLTHSLVQQFSGVSVIRAYVVKIFDKVFHENGLVESNINNITSVLGVRN